MSYTPNDRSGQLAPQHDSSEGRVKRAPPDEVAGGVEVVSHLSDMEAERNGQKATQWDVTASRTDAT